MVAANLQKHQVQIRKVPSTDTRWNLRDQSKYQKWHSDLERIVRGATCKDFLGSTAPSMASIQPHPYSSTQQTLEELGELVGQWMQHDELLFDILHGSLDLNETELDFVSQHFTPNLQGNDFYKWVSSHANHAKESQQLSLKNEIKSLSIQDGDTAAQIDNTLLCLQLT